MEVKKKKNSNKILLKMTHLTLKKRNEELRLCLTIAPDEDKEVKNVAAVAEKMLLNSDKQVAAKEDELNKNKNDKESFGYILCAEKRSLKD
ncbi:hypothetical protein Tco_0684625 [Tanacetum coccineum]